MSSRLVASAALCGALVAAPASAAAQAPAAAPPAGPGADKVQRAGFVAGLGLGGGSYHVDCGLVCDVLTEDRYGGGALSLHLGGMLTRRLALLFDIWAVRFEPDADHALAHNMGTLALRWFAAERIWLQGGLGWANFTLDCRDGATGPGCDDESRTGGALVFAGGVEVLQYRHFTVDVMLRAGWGGFDDARTNMGALAVGVNWY